MREKSFLFVIPLLLLAYVAQAQRSETPAQISTGSPLPVYVTNTPSLPEGFVQGSRWRFTTWTAPSVITWTGTVNRTSGAWANLTIRTDNGQTSTAWFYIPGMQGSWEQH